MTMIVQVNVSLRESDLYLADIVPTNDNLDFVYEFMRFREYSMNLLKIKSRINLRVGKFYIIENNVFIRNNPNGIYILITQFRSL